MVGGYPLIKMIRRGQSRVVQIGRRAVQQQSTRKGLWCRDRSEGWICQRGQEEVRVHEESSDEAIEVESKEYTKEEREDSMKPTEGEKSIKLSMKKERKMLGGRCKAVNQIIKVRWDVSTSVLVV